MRKFLFIFKKKKVLIKIFTFFNASNSVPHATLSKPSNQKIPKLQNYFYKIKYCKISKKNNIKYLNQYNNFKKKWN